MGTRTEITQWNHEKNYNLFKMCAINDSFLFCTGDSLTPNNNNEDFSTRDRDNDDLGGISCVVDYGYGAWWHGYCYYYPLSFLNGDYNYGYIFWNTLPGYDYNIQYTEMKIRPV